MQKIKMTMGSSEITLSQAFEEFQKINVSKRLENCTIVNYKNAFLLLGQFLDINMKCSDFNQDKAIDYLCFLRQKDVHDETVNTYIRNIRVFFNYCTNLGYMEKLDIKLPKAVREIKETYSDEELALLLKKPDIKKCSFMEYRNWVIVNYLLATGNRLATLAGIRISDLDFENDTVKLAKTKNGKQQIVPLSSTLSKILSEYLRYRNGVPEDYLFCNQYGQRLTKDGISTAVERYNRSRGVARTSVHAFRHTFAKKWILNGGDIFKLQKLLGHSSLEMVRNYVNLYSNELKENYDSFNPLESVYRTNNLAEKHKMKMKKLI